LNIIYIYLITTQKSNTEYLFHSWCNFDLENINEGHLVYHSYPNITNVFTRIRYAGGFM